MPDRPYIYVDMLFIINFIMDYIALWATARLSQIRCVPWRLATAACLGSLYSIVVLLPGLSFLTALWVKFLVSLLMLGAAFIPFHLKKFGQVLLYFYLIAFTMGGTVLGFIYLMSNFSINPAFSNIPIPYLWLTLGLGTAFLLGKWGVPYLKKTFLRDLLRVPVIIKVSGRQLKITGLVDTGNQLVDPLTGAPVVIVEHEVLAPYLPPNTRDFFGGGGELDIAKLSRSLQEDGEVLPFRLIPFTTIGKHHGMLVGFRPEEITILAGDQKIRNTNVVIGLYNRRLSPRGAYRALIHPDLLHAPAGA